MSLRVLHVIPSVAPCRGGPSQAVIEMVNALNAAGSSAEIACTNDDGYEVLNVPLNTLTQYQHAPVRFFKRFSPPLASLREFQFSIPFMRWLNQHIDDYDLIHIHAIFSFCSSYAMWLARQKGLPYVVRPIGQLEQWSLKQSELKKKYYLKLVERNNLRNAAAIHCTATSEQQQAEQLFEQLNYQVIPLGITPATKITDAQLQLRARYQLKTGIPVISYMGRLHPKKGIERLLSALAKVTRPYALLIAGEGDASYVHQLREIANTQVQFLGFVQNDDKDLLLQGSDLFTLTSYSENFGIAVLEALAAGTPALVTREVALSNVIEQAELGYVADNTISSISKQLNIALTKIEQGVDRRQAISNYIAQNYQWPTIATQLLTLYQAINASQ